MKTAKIVIILLTLIILLPSSTACRNRAEEEVALLILDAVSRINIVSRQFRADVIVHGDLDPSLEREVGAGVWIHRILAGSVDVTKVEFTFIPTENTLLMLDELNIMIEEIIARNGMYLLENDVLMPVTRTDSSEEIYGTLTFPITIEDLVYDNTRAVNDIFNNLFTQEERNRIHSVTQ